MFYRKKEYFVDVTIYDYNLVLLEKIKLQKKFQMNWTYLKKI